MLLFRNSNTTYYKNTPFVCQSAERGSLRQDLVCARANKKCVHVCKRWQRVQCVQQCRVGKMQPKNLSICLTMCAQQLFLQKCFQAFHKTLTSDYNLVASEKSCVCTCHTLQTGLYVV